MTYASVMTNGTFQMCIKEMPHRGINQNCE